MTYLLALVTTVSGVRSDAMLTRSTQGKDRPEKSLEHTMKSNFVKANIPICGFIFW